MTLNSTNSALIERTLQSNLRIQPISSVIYNFKMLLLTFLLHIFLLFLVLNNLLVFYQSKTAIFVYLYTRFFSLWILLICYLRNQLNIFILCYRKYICKLFVCLGSLWRLHLYSLGINFISEILTFSQTINQYFKSVFQLWRFFELFLHSHFSFDNFIIIAFKQKLYTIFNFSIIFTKFWPMYSTQPQAMA